MRQPNASETSQKFTKEGTPVRYIRSTFVPEEGGCMCLFAAESAEDVKRVNKAAKISFDHAVRRWISRLSDEPRPVRTREVQRVAGLAFHALLATAAGTSERSATKRSNAAG